MCTLLPPTVPEPFRDWLFRQPVSVTLWVHNTVRICLYRLLHRAPPDLVVDYTARVMVPLMRIYVHRHLPWEPPAVTFILHNVRGYLREERGQPQQLPGTPGGGDEHGAEPFDGSIPDTRPAASAAIAEAAKQAQQAIDAALAEHHRTLHEFNSQWRQKEGHVLRTMSQSPPTTWIALQLRGWTVQDIAAWFGAKEANVDTNWRSRGNKAFEQAWAEAFGTADWQAYREARHAAAEATRALQRYETELRYQEGQS